MNKRDSLYRVFLTSCWPACWKVGRFSEDDNATCNFYRSKETATQEAHRRNQLRRIAAIFDEETPPNAN